MSPPSKKKKKKSVLILKHFVPELVIVGVPDVSVASVKTPAALFPAGWTQIYRDVVK